MPKRPVRKNVRRQSGADGALTTKAPLRIGDAARACDLTVDTLRYYEKIGLMPRALKRGGARYYHDTDLSRLRFIRRAQTLGFSLEEIQLLLELRQQPTAARPEIRALARAKLENVERIIAEMDFLKKELQLLLHLCECSECGCPIIDGIDTASASVRSQRTKRKPPRPHLD